MPHVNLRINDKHRAIDKIFSETSMSLKIPQDLLAQDLEEDKKSETEI